MRRCAVVALVYLGASHVKFRAVRPFTNIDRRDRLHSVRGQIISVTWMLGQESVSIKVASYNVQLSPTRAR